LATGNRVIGGTYSNQVLGDTVVADRLEAIAIITVILGMN